MTINFNGFDFDQVDVFGKSIPCEYCIEQAWGELSDSSKLEFHTYSNVVVKKMREDFQIPLSNYQIVRNFLVSTFYQIDRKLCFATGFNFTTLIQANFAYRWFISLLGNFPGNRLSTVEKLVPIIYVAHSGGKLTKTDKANANRVNSMPDYSRLSKLSEFEKAEKILENFGRRVKALVPLDSEVSLAFMVKNGIIIELAKLGESKDGSIIAFCPFCRCLSCVTLTTKQFTHCVNCDKAYKKSLRPKKITDWVKDPNVRPKLCIGECGSRDRGLNSQRYCRECWKKTSS